MIWAQWMCLTPLDFRKRLKLICFKLWSVVRCKLFWLTINKKTNDVIDEVVVDFISMASGHLECESTTMKTYVVEKDQQNQHGFFAMVWMASSKDGVVPLVGNF